MGGDLPDYSRKVIVVYEGTITSGEVKCDHWKIKGLTLKDPYISLSLPMSVENPALAYDAVNDRFKIVLEAITAGVIPISLANDWTRQLGLVDLSRVLGAALSHSNPVISRLTNGSAFIDPRDRNWTVTEALARSWVLGATDIPDLSDRAARLLGVIANTSFQVSNFPSEYALPASQVADLKVTSGTATVTQVAKDRTISSVDATATPLQISLAALNGNSAALVTPAAGKAVRIKFISIEHSADVDLGYRFGAAGTIYYLRTTKGVYVSNLIGCNNQGAADAAFYMNSSAATNVKGYVLYTEV
jgi:hypothetical protein